MSVWWWKVRLFSEDYNDFYDRDVAQRACFRFRVREVYGADFETWSVRFGPSETAGEKILGLVEVESADYRSVFRRHVFWALSQWNAFGAVLEGGLHCFCGVPVDDRVSEAERRFTKWSVPFVTALCRSGEKFLFLIVFTGFIADERIRIYGTGSAADVDYPDVRSLVFRQASSGGGSQLGPEFNGVQARRRRLQGRVDQGRSGAGASDGFGRGGRGNRREVRASESVVDEKRAK